jgi:hypothetical protein
MMRNRFSMRILVSALFFSAMLVPPASADARFADPAGRFHGQVPPNWTVETSPDQPLGLRSRGNILVIFDYTDDGSAEDVLSRTLQTTGRLWTRFHETGRTTTNVAGQVATVVTCTGVSPKGVGSIFRLTVAPMGSGVLAVAATVPKEQYGLARITLENIEENLGAGTAPAAVATLPRQQSSEAILEEAFRAGMLSREAYETATRGQPAPDTAAAIKAERPATSRPALGVRARDLEDAERERLHLDGGAIVAQVQPGGPGHAAGLRVGDVIRSLDGMPVTDAQGLVQAIGRRRIDERVRLEVWREGDRLVLQSTLSQPAR